MIALKYRCLVTLVCLFAISTDCCFSTPNVPLKGVRNPLPVYTTEPTQQRTYEASGGNYLPSGSKKAQPALFGANPRLPPLNGAQNFNPQPSKDELLNKNYNKSFLKDPSQTAEKDTNTNSRVPSSKPATTVASPVTQTQPAQQLASPADEILKQVQVAGPMQTGTSNVNINNNVSNIKVGNTKSENINYGIPALHRERLLGSPIEARKRALNDIGLRYGDTNQAYGSGFVPKQRPVVYTNQPSPSYLFGEDDYFADNGGYGESGDYLEDYGTPNNNQVSDNNPNPDQPKKCNKKKQKPTAEQVELKNQLLDLASKATSSTVPDDSPLLKYNKETGAFEQIQVDPNAQLYKDKLQEALNALSAKKLSSKKLKKVLLDDPSNESSADPEQADQPQHDDSFEDLKTSDGSRNQNRKLSDIGTLPQSGGNRRFARNPGAGGLAIDGSTSQYGGYNSQTPEDQYMGSGSSSSLYNERADYGNYPARNNQVDLSSLDGNQRRSLVDQVRAVLNDNLNRFNEVVLFSEDFLEQLVFVEDDELTPIEREFKHLILCNSDERYCNREPEEQVLDQQRYDDSTPEVNEPNPANYADDGQQGQQQANEWYQEPAENNDDYGYGQPAEEAADRGSGRVRYSGEPSEEQLEEELVARRGGLNGGDEGTYSRQSGSNSYLYNRSAGGARNGVPLVPQKQHYAEQSSYLRSNQGPTTVAARPSSPMESNGGRFNTQAKQQQQPIGLVANSASQGASLNGLAIRGGQQRSATQPQLGRYSAVRADEASSPVKLPAPVERGQPVSGSFQQRQLGRQQNRAPSGASSNGPSSAAAAANGRALIGGNLNNPTNMGRDSVGNRPKLQQAPRQVQMQH